MNHENLNNLITEALAIEAREAKEAGALGFMARALVQATLPHKKLAESVFRRRNGLFQLSMFADPEIGLPYGSIPRLLLAWITTEAVRTKQREITLGRTLSKFMEKIDLVPTGGRWGTITRLQEQMKRLFSASVSCTYDDGKRWAIKNVQPITHADLWWNIKSPRQATFVDSTLILGKEFFNEIISYPIPVDMDVLKALKKSPMALDIYCWLTYRVSYLKKHTLISWEVLKIQFGSDYASNPQGLRDFKRAFLRELKKIYLIYPDAKLGISPNGLSIYPTKTHIPRVVVHNPVD